jgi:cytochrome c-type biogenesis protein CcmF
LFAAMFILFATMFPTLSEAVTGERLTVGPPFYNKWMLPVGLMLLGLTGVGPLLAWRKSALVNLRNQFMWPVLMGVIVAGAMVAGGVRVWASGICFALSAFVTTTIAQEFWRGARVRQANSGTDVFTALIGLVGRNKRRYGGYVVHLGMVLIFFGFAGEGFKQSEQVLLRPGQQTTLGDFTVRLDALRVSDDDRKQMVTAHMTLFKDGQEIDRMFPAKWFFRKHENQPTTEVAIRRGFAEDVYLTLMAFELKDQSASMEFNVNPLVNWVWVGFGVLAMGTFIALLPEQAFAFATATMPAGAATTSMLLLALVLWPALANAQSSVEVKPKPRSDVQRQLEHEILCTCGGCKLSVGVCGMMNCHGKEQQAEKIEAHLASGKDHDAVIDAFVKEYGGQDILAAPIDKGFNRLAWMVPYAIGFGGLLLMVVMAAMRWSRVQRPATAGGPDLDADFNDRLDDELRNLD